MADKLRLFRKVRVMNTYLYPHSWRLFLPALLFLVLIFANCGKQVGNLFVQRTPHQRYEDKLRNAGLDATELGRKWLAEGEQCLRQPIPLQLPYLEQGYFEATDVRAIAFRFSLLQGRRCTVRLVREPALQFILYLDLWRIREGKSPDHVLSSDTSGTELDFNAEESGDYLLRLQPELLKGGSYTLSITTGPSLGYPVPSLKRTAPSSSFGDVRDAGRRRHEGVDLFAKKGTPVVACAAGTVRRVTDGGLGGKTVWLSVRGRNLSLYYAHLDSQLVREGQQVEAGGVLGLVGNTGNARFTGPHLHFGIYTGYKAVDPFPFIDPSNPLPPPVEAPGLRSFDSLRSKRSALFYPSWPAVKKESTGMTTGQLVFLYGKSGEYYRVGLPDGRKGFVKSAALEKLDKLHSQTVQEPVNLLDAPLTEAVSKRLLPTGEKVDILAYSGNFMLVKQPAYGKTGWVKRGE